MLNKIKKKQNEEEMLKCQYVARFFYNRAEKLNYLGWLCAILAVVSTFIPEKYEVMTIVVPVIIGLMELGIQNWFEKCIEKGALLRNYFDAQVIELYRDRYSSEDIRRIKELVYDVTEKHVRECEIQIRNTGRDNPPGVKDWYEFNNKNVEDAQFECQRMNCWWDKYESKIRIIFTYMLLIFCVAMVLAVFSLTKATWWKLFVFYPVFVTIVRRMRANQKYHEISLKIEGAKSVVSENGGIGEKLTLQRLIEEKRMLPVLQINAIHKKIAKKLSERYERIG